MMKLSIRDSKMADVDGVKIQETNDISHGVKI